MKLEIRKDYKRYPNEKKWQFCVGSCHASTLLRKDTCRMLKKVHDELGIKYVRFHGIFCDDMNTISTFKDILSIPGGEKLRETTFYKCGLVYDNVLESGMKPFVELSFMPNFLAREKAAGGFYGSNMNMPESLAAWALYIQSFIKYLIHRYGQEEVETWYFEVWNEPDLKGMFFNGTKEEYFKLYEATAAAVKQVCPTLKVGGPATSASKWVPEFISFCEDNKIALDFVSTHQYVGDPFLGISDEDNAENGQMKADDEETRENTRNMMEQAAKMFETVSEDTTLLSALRGFAGDPTEDTEMDRDRFYKNVQIVRAQAAKYPLFYTEWNMCATFGAYSNDTRKAAAYDVRAALQTEEYIDGSSIWCYSDVFEELHQFTEEFHGGFGLLTIDGIPKPVFYGMKMLAESEENRISLPQNQFQEIEAAAFEGEKEIQILLFRQNMKQTNSGKQKIEIAVELDKEAAAVSLERIDEEHCNPLKAWEEAGRPRDLNRNEIEVLKETSKMKKENLDFSYVDGKLETEVELGVNDIYFIRIEK